jgi:hypothetical protein
MYKKSVRFIANIIILVGIIYLFKVLIQSFNGILVQEIFNHQNQGIYWGLMAMLLGLPIPAHIISIGLILQKKWLSDSMQRLAWISIVFSGVWLGTALGIKMII